MQRKVPDKNKSDLVISIKWLMRKCETILAHKDNWCHVTLHFMFTLKARSHHEC